MAKVFNPTAHPVIMSTLSDNTEYGDKLKTILGLRHEPVAVRLIREGEDPPKHQLSDKQMSHCQAVASATRGNSFVLMKDMQECKVGASSLGMAETPDKVRSGEFHFGMGAHDTVDATAKMIAARSEVNFKAKGAAYSPLSKADFKPDVVIIEDIPERVYWFVALSTAKEGGRVKFSTAPFQAACVDCIAVPLATGSANISIGCFGCRKRTEIAKDEMLIGVPFQLIPEMTKTLAKYKDGILTKAKRD
jgi:uncharacterized protein (DUF169 family)